MVNCIVYLIMVGIQSRTFSVIDLVYPSNCQAVPCKCRKAKCFVYLLITLLYIEMHLYV